MPMSGRSLPWILVAMFVVKLPSPVYLMVIPLAFDQAAHDALS
jgi:hypothetical protein